MELNAKTDTPQLENPAVIYRCKKCRRIVSSQENLVAQAWEGCDQKEWEKDPVDFSSIFLEPMKWMQTVQGGYVEEKLLRMGCNARLGSFNWTGMQCNCGAWVDPAFQPHKSRLDECHM